jgi:hypothetical protein
MRGYFQSSALKSTSVLGFTTLGRVIARTHVGLRVSLRKEKKYVNLRCTGFHVAGAVVLFTAAIFAPLPSYAQVNGAAHASSASHISAEITKGRLNPAESKPGDTVAIKLKDDVRSNGEVILKKGAIITGVIRNVRRADPKGELNGPAQSMMEIEWLAPAAQGRTERSLSFALQSVMQVSPIYRHEQSDSLANDIGLESSGLSSSPAARPVHAASGNSLLGSVGASPAVAAAVTPASSSVANGRSNVALLSMPSVVAVDRQTSSSIESTLGTSSSGQLFRVGHGELISAVGSKQSVELYSHLSNDTVITSGRNFEISSGAQIQMLVGVNRN